MPLTQPVLDEIIMTRKIVAQCRDILNGTEKKLNAFESVADYTEDVELGPAVVRARDAAQLALDNLSAQLAKL